MKAKQPPPIMGSVVRMNSEAVPSKIQEMGVNPYCSLEIKIPDNKGSIDRI